MAKRAVSRSAKTDALSVEERLLGAHEFFMLLVDLFDLRVTVIGQGQDEPLSPSACSALSNLCRKTGDDLRLLLEDLPSEVLNRIAGRRAVRPRTHR